MQNDEAERLATVWTNEIIEFPAATRFLRQSIQSILHAYFPDDDAYPAEKFIKSFAEPISYLVSIYHQQEIDRIGADYRGGHLSPHQIERWREVLPGIEQKLRVDIARQHRYFTTFLAAIKLTPPGGY